MDLDRIYCGDAYKLIRKIPDKSVDLIVTDPPYDFGCKVHQVSSGLFRSRTCVYGGEIEKLGCNKHFDTSILDDYLRILKHCNIYIWCNKNQIFDYLDFFTRKHNFNFEIFTWCKLNPPPFVSRHYLKDKEYCLFFWESTSYLKVSYQTGKTFFVTDTNVADKSIFGHPCCKPENIISNFISNSSCVGDVVFDSFVGSGTTCAVAKKLGRHYLGFEINKKFFQVAIDRCNGVTPYTRKLKNAGQMSLF